MGYDFGKTFCLGTCGYSCTKSMRPSRPKQTNLGLYPGAKSLVALTTKLYATTNTVSNSLQTIAISLSFDCGTLLARNGTAFRSFDGWNGPEDGTLMRAPPVGQRFMANVTTPSSKWNLALYKKVLKVAAESGAVSHLNKVMLCTTETDHQGKPQAAEMCCVDKELTPDNMANDINLASQLKAW